MRVQQKYYWWWVTQMIAGRPRDRAKSLWHKLKNGYCCVWDPIRFYVLYKATRFCCISGYEVQEAAHMSCLVCHHSIVFVSYCVYSMTTQLASFAHLVSTFWFFFFFISQDWAVIWIWIIHFDNSILPISYWRTIEGNEAFCQDLKLFKIENNLKKHPLSQFSLSI